MVHHRRSESQPAARLHFEETAIPHAILFREIVEVERLSRHYPVRLALLDQQARPRICWAVMGVLSGLSVKPNPEPPS